MDLKNYSLIKKKSDKVNEKWCAFPSSEWWKIRARIQMCVLWFEKKKNEKKIIKKKSSKIGQTNVKKGYLRKSIKCSDLYVFCDFTKKLSR